MRHIRTRFLLLVAVFGAAVVAASFNIGRSPQYAEALSGTVIAGTSSQSRTASTSADGRYIAFLSGSPSLVSGDTNNKVDAFVRDTKLNTTTRISLSTTGTQSSRDIDRVILSGNGRYAILNTYGNTLGASGAFSASNVYLRDIKLGTTTLVAAGDGGTGRAVSGEALSEDARFIYYSELDPTYYYTLRVMDTHTNTSSRIDTDNSGNLANNNVLQGSSTSCDGRYVTFASKASNLTANDTNAVTDIFLVDNMNGHLVRNITATADGGSNGPTISCDGNYIIFFSQATNLLSTDANGSQMDLIRYDIANETFDNASLDSSNGQYGDTNSTNGAVVPGANDVAISSEGRYIAFTVRKNFSGVLNSQVEVRDMLTGTTSDIGLPFNSTNDSNGPSLTANGKVLNYTSNGGAYGYDIYTSSGY